MCTNASTSAELIVSRLATDSGCSTAINIPTCLSDDVIDEIMLKYLSDESAVNLNFVEPLFNWPDSAMPEYNPSPRVRVCAKRVFDSVQQKLLDGSCFTYGCGIRIDAAQRACKGVEFHNRTLCHVFGQDWLDMFTDYPTIMNNLQYIYDFADVNGLMLAPAHKYEEDTLFAMLGSHVVGEYRTNTNSRIRENIGYAGLVAYSRFLEKKGIRLEEALEWVYNTYFEDEYCIAGFSISLSSRETSWLDKCKAMGPEIERVLKAYALLSKHGVIDDSYFPFETFKSFSEFGALSEKKYAVEGDNFDEWGFLLFSDQCLLSYRRDHEDHADSFYSLLLAGRLYKDDYDQFCIPDLSRLIDNGFVGCRDDNSLYPTIRSALLYGVWKNGAIALRRCTDMELKVIDSLADEGALAYCDKLFSPDESAYLDYMFNNATYPNAIALRNKYDHARSSVSDPNSAKYQEDYYQFLSLMISITIKINEELSFKTDRGYLEDFVEWPLYDDSVINFKIESSDD